MNVLDLHLVSVDPTPAGWEGAPSFRWAQVEVLAPCMVSTDTGMGLGLPRFCLTGMIFPASHLTFSDAVQDGVGESLSPDLTLLVEVTATAVFVLFGWSGAVIA